MGCQESRGHKESKLVNFVVFCMVLRMGKNLPCAWLDTFDLCAENTGDMVRWS